MKNPNDNKENTIELNLRVHVKKLALEIGERNVFHHSNLQQAANYIINSFNKDRYKVKKYKFKVDNKCIYNIEAEAKFNSLNPSIIILGAHYDSVVASPGADDNASGVAVMLEIARLLTHVQLENTIRFVAFVNEEPPFFQTKEMGSYIYANNAKLKNENIIAMFSLESLGYFSDVRGSQQYPLSFLKWLYPDVGNFIGFVSNIHSRKILNKVKVLFKKFGLISFNTMIAPENLAGVGWSDHWSFWKQGYPAIMITDTALFRNPYYHSKEDTPNTISYSQMVLFVKSMTRVIVELDQTI